MSLYKSEKLKKMKKIASLAIMAGKKINFFLIGFILMYVYTNQPSRHRNRDAFILIGIYIIL